MLKKLQIYTGISDIALINDMLRYNRVQVVTTHKMLLRRNWLKCSVTFFAISVVS